MSAPAILRIVLQREGQSDCAIATLASYIGRSYEEVLVAASRVTKGDVLKGGLHGTEIERTSRKLGCRLKRVAWESVAEDDVLGMLYVKGRFNGEKYEEHAVLYRDGTIIDCRDGTFWPSDAYFKHYAADPIALMVTQ
jgi:hypothetical protein